jgi:SAM-dependent methyltransferase
MVDSAYFQSRYAWTPGRDQAWKSICAYLQRYVPDAGAVLDLGAGYCSFINHVNAAEKHALDIYPGFTEHAQAGVKTHVGDCRHLVTFAPQQFDVVFASNLLEHLTLSDSQTVLQGIRRILKPQGRLILVQPNFRLAYRRYFDDYTHVQIFTDAGLANFLSSMGYHVDHIEPRFLPFSFKSRWPTWSWLVALYLRLPWRPFAGQMLVVAHVE